MPSPQLTNRSSVAMAVQAPDWICETVSSQADIARVAALARQIWVQHYVPIVGPAQVEYMLNKFQSETAIAAQIAEGHQYFLIRPKVATASDEAYPHAGYMDVVADQATKKLFVSKLYVIAIQHGQGAGRAMLHHAIQLAKGSQLSALSLTVNKHNPTLSIYMHWGFNNIGAVIKDIGGGFVMDDYQLEMTL